MKTEQRKLSELKDKGEERQRVSGDSLSSLWDKIKSSNKQIIGVSEGEERDIRALKGCGERMAKCFQISWKTETHKLPRKTNTEAHRHPVAEN